MGFAAYESDRIDADVSYGERKEARGLMGKLKPKSSPIAVAENVEELRQKARAHLGEFPDALLYLVDGDMFVLEILTNEKHHEIVRQAVRWQGALAGILLFCLTSFLVGAVLVGNPAGCLIRFAIVTMLYVGILSIKIVNEIAAAVVCEMVLIALLITV
jgi:hypothetical protein